MVSHFFSYMGDLQLHAFNSFMRNQIEWNLAMKLVDTNKEKVALWIRTELGMATELRHDFKRFISTLDVREKSTIELRHDFKRFISTLDVREKSTMYKMGIVGFYPNLFCTTKE